MWKLKLWRKALPQGLEGYIHPRQLGVCLSPPPGHQLTITVGPLHVVLHVALLRESDAAQLALEGLPPRVFDHMDLQSALLIEGLVTLSALEGTLACTNTRQTWQMGF